MVRSGAPELSKKIMEIDDFQLKRAGGGRAGGGGVGGAGRLLLTPLRASERPLNIRWAASERL